MCAEIINLGNIKKKKRKGNGAPHPQAGSDTLVQFAAAALPKDRLANLNLTHDIEESLKEIVATYYNNYKNDWIEQGLSLADKDKKAQAFVHTVNEVIGQLQMYGYPMFPGHITPAPVYCAVIMEVLGEGRADNNVNWQHKDAVEGTSIAKQARMLDPQHIRTNSRLDQNSFNILFTRQYLVTYRLEKAFYNVKAGEPLKTLLANFTPYREATQYTWPPSALTSDMLMFARRLHLWCGYGPHPTQTS